MCPPRRLRWRDEFLAEFGGAWMLLGVMYAIRSDRLVGLEPVTGRLVTLDVLAAGWMITGAVAVAYAIRPWRNGRGFMALVIMPGVWIGSYLWSWVSWLATGQGEARGLLVALVWLLVTRAVILVAGRADPPSPVDPR